MKKLRELWNKEYSKEVARNWYLALCAAMVTGSFFAPSSEAQLVLILMAAIVGVFTAIVYSGKG